MFEYHSISKSWICLPLSTMCFYLLCICNIMNSFIINSRFLANVNSHSRSLFAVARPSVCLSSVTFVRPTQAVQMFGNISTALGTLAIR